MAAAWPVFPVLCTSALLMGAAAVREEPEETEKPARLTQDEIGPLGEAQVQELRDKFDAQW